MKAQLASVGFRGHPIHEEDWDPVMGRCTHTNTHTRVSNSVSESQGYEAKGALQTLQVHSSRKKAPPSEEQIYRNLCVNSRRQLSLPKHPLPRNYCNCCGKENCVRRPADTVSWYSHQPCEQGVAPCDLWATLRQAQEPRIILAFWAMTVVDN